MVHLQTINQMDFEPAAPEGTGKIEKAQRLGPEVIGRKVVYPGVDQDKIRCHMKPWYGSL